MDSLSISKIDPKINKAFVKKHNRGGRFLTVNHNKIYSDRIRHMTLEEPNEDGSEEGKFMDQASKGILGAGNYGNINVPDKRSEPSEYSEFNEDEKFMVEKPRIKITKVKYAEHYKAEHQNS